MYEWGLGKKSVNAKLYFIEADTLRLVGDITWLWHPGEQKILGYGTAVGMGVDVFDYNTTFESPKKMVNLFKAYGERDANSEIQMEVLEFINDDEYLWTYFNFIGGEPSPAYSNTFSRTEKRPF